MTRQTQGFLLALLGAVLLRHGLTDTYLRYVTGWMKWPIVASGVLLILLAIAPMLSDPDAEDGHDGHDGHDRVPLATWLLLLPALITFVVMPPELGSYLAERRANQGAPPAPVDAAALPEGRTTSLSLQEFVWRAQTGSSMADRSVKLTGFVSRKDDHWYVTRLTIGCCAADAMAFRVRVEGPEAPPKDQWVTVVGEHVAGTGAKGSDPVIAALDVARIAKPKQPYE